MGHERVGALPRTQPWRTVVAQIADAAAVEGNVRDLAKTTLENVRTRLLAIHKDPGFVASFRFLLRISLSASATIDRHSLGEPAIDLDANPSPLDLALALCQYVNDNRESAEYAAIAQKAAVDAISSWTSQNTQQLSLTADQDHALEVWRRASTGAGFCEVARLFFGNFVARYLNYFIGREAASCLATTEDRNRLARRLELHVDAISHHAFETTKITESFAAGWFNRHAREGMPSDREVSGFLSHAIGKLREEIIREELSQ